ncbi:MAG: hypothetical protein Q8N81_02240 [bacterium]|nr:hypothetical protein [bacterium]
MTHKPTQLFLLFVLILVLVGVTLVAERDQRSWLFGKRSQSPLVKNSGGPTLILEHKYAASVNTYRGSVESAKPCDVLETSVELSSGQPEQIKLILATDKSPSACQGGTVKKDFTIVIPSSTQAQLEEVKFNGQPLAFELRSSN